MLQVSPWDKREEANEKKQAFALANSDHLALLQAYKVCLGLNSVQWEFMCFADLAAPKKQLLKSSLFQFVCGACWTSNSAVCISAFGPQ